MASTISTAAAPGEAPPLADVDVASTAALLSHSSRCAMLWALSDGRALTAGELARIAGIAASTASEHLAQLLSGDLLLDERHGRHHYFRLAGPGVVQALEALARLSPPRSARSFREAAAGRAIRFARTCYDHLAGTVGVQLTDALEEDGSLVLRGRDYELTPAGEARLRQLGVDVDDARASRRTFARACLDWSERRYHLAGALGAALCTRLLDLGWVERQPATRALRITNVGRRAFRRHFEVTVL